VTRSQEIGASPKRKSYTGAQAHLSQTGKGGGKAACGNSRARMTCSRVDFEATREDARCGKCLAKDRQLGNPKQAVKP
jgi:hypothetical protein